jgi:HEAT repeat protein
MLGERQFDRRSATVMKQRNLVLGSIVIAGLLGLLLFSNPQREITVQGRPVIEWVNEVNLNIAFVEKDVALNTLVSAGPTVLPAVSRILTYSESPKDMAMRLPGIPPETRNRQTSTSEPLLLKAKAAWVIGVIAARNPGAAESAASVPGLISALGSGNGQVRFLSAQALGAIGKGATNAIAALVTRTRDEDSSLRMSAVEALGRIGTGDPMVIAALRKASSDTNTDVGVTARLALEAVCPSGL